MIHRFKCGLFSNVQRIAADNGGQMTGLQAKLGDVFSEFEFENDDQVERAANAIEQLDSSIATISRSDQRRLHVLI